MTRSQLHAGLAVGSALLIAGVVAITPAVRPVSAQGQADRICQREGIGPSSAGFEYCMSQATRAIEWGKPEIARALARVTADAQDACMANGLEPTTTSYRACMDSETFARAQSVFTDDPQIGPQIANP